MKAAYMKTNVRKLRQITSCLGQEQLDLDRIEQAYQAEICKAFGWQRWNVRRRELVKTFFRDLVRLGGSSQGDAISRLLDQLELYIISGRISELGRVRSSSLLDSIAKRIVGGI